MTIALCFWILMLVALAFGVLWSNRADWRGSGPSILVFLLFLLLGWAVLGAPIRG